MFSTRVRPGQTLRLFDLLTAPSGVDLSAINFKLHNIIYNCNTEQLDLHTAPSSSLTVIPGVFMIGNGILSFRMSLSRSSFGNIVTGFSGQWTLGGLTMTVLARYDNQEKTLFLRGAPRRGLTVNLQKMINSLTGTIVPIPLPSSSITNIVVTGEIQLTKGGLATVVVSGSIDRNRVHAIFQKPAKSGKFFGAFAADIGPLRLSDLIKKTTAVDLSSVPFFGSISIPRLGFTIASNYITSALLPSVFCHDCFLRCTGLTIPKGLTAYMKLNLKGQKVPLKMHYFQSVLSMEVTEGNNLSIGSLLSVIPGVNVRSIPLPSGVRSILGLKINEFSLDTTSKRLEMDSKLPGTLRYFNGYLTVTDMEMKLHAVLKRQRSLYIEVDGAIKIGDGDYDITIRRDSTTSKYIFRASFKKISISDFIKKFSAKLLPRQFQKVLQKFTQFSIRNAVLVFPLGTRNLQVHLSGTPVIAGYRSVHMSAIIVRQGGQTKLVGGFQLGKVNVATLIRKITSIDLRKIGILNNNLDTSLLISPVSLPGVRLYGSKLKDLPIAKGVTISSLIQWPSNCARDVFCAIAKRLLRGNKLTLQGTMETTKKFTLSAGVSDVRLGSGVVLQRAGLQVTAGIETSYGIVGSIHLKNPGITLSAEIRLGTRGVVLEGNMQGCWKRAFGAKWLSICNLHLLVAIQPTVTLVGALSIGGQVRIGNPSCLRNPITAAGYVGFDQLSPRNNFYYVQVKRSLTVRTILQAFCINFRLPHPLAESGFPKGFLSSFSLVGKELPKVGISIPAGYRLKGTINILGLSAQADVTISLPKGVKMSVGLSPLRIARGLLQMYASRRDRSRGPFLTVSITLVPRANVNIHASGFISVLGIQAEAMLRITNTKYEVTVNGRFLRLFQASLRITANYGNIKQASFQVSGRFRSDFFAAIRSKIKKGLRKSSQAATRAIDNAKKKVNSKKAIFDRADSKLSSAQRRVNSANGAFNRAINKLKGWEGKVRRLCRIRSCRQSEQNKYNIITKNKI